METAKKIFRMVLCYAGIFLSVTCTTDKLGCAMNRKEILIVAALACVGAFVFEPKGDSEK